MPEAVDRCAHSTFLTLISFTLCSAMKLAIQKCQGRRWRWPASKTGETADQCALHRQIYFRTPICGKYYSNNSFGAYFLLAAWIVESAAEVVFADSALILMMPPAWIEDKISLASQVHTEIPITIFSDRTDDLIIVPILLNGFTYRLLKVRYSLLLLALMMMAVEVGCKLTIEIPPSINFKSYSFFHIRKWRLPCWI